MSSACLLQRMTVGGSWGHASSLFKYISTINIPNIDELPKYAWYLNPFKNMLIY